VVFWCIKVLMQSPSLQDQGCRLAIFGYPFQGEQPALHKD